MRYLAIDLGDRRTGLAVGDDESGIVSAAGVLEHPIRSGATLLDALGRAIAEHEPDELVMGLPLNMDGSEGPRAKLVRAYAAQLAERCTLPIRFQDERLTSAQADWEMARSGMTHKQKKQRRDALAAAAILRDYLLTLASGSGGAASEEEPPSDSSEG